ncbi:MAG: hypothetical protein LLF75_11380 [Eubacteriales bacterium]|nr:hypothetical protein [Eubacteriales bacterium]
MSRFIRRAAVSAGALLIEALYPGRVACALCNREAILNEQNLCASCAASLQPCGIVPSSPPLDGLVAAYRYKGGVIAGIHALKYNKQTRLAPFFAEAIDLPPEWRIDVVIPVPLHPFKKWLRTYNQSERIASSLARKWSLPTRDSLLRRTRFTRTQTALDEFERAKNVARAFSASPAVKGLRVLLVDDVTTTQSTLLACAAALKEAGASHIYAACACFAAKEPE